jgi:hypothetical protein
MRRTFLAVVVLLALCGALLLFSWYGDYAGVNGQDAHDHWRLARAWMEWWVGGVRPEAAEHPHGYPFLGALVGLSGVGGLWGLRLVSLFAFAALMLALRAILLRLHGAGAMRPIDRYLLLAAATCPFLLRYAATVMSDVTAMALLMGSFLALLRWLDQGRWPDVLWCMLLGMWSLWVRMAVAPMLLVMGAALVLDVPTGRALRLAVSGMLAFAAGLLLLRPAYADVVGTRLWVPLSDWSPWNIFARVHRSDDGLLAYQLPNALYVLKLFLHPGFLLLGPVLLLFVRMADLAHRPVRWGVAALVAYIAFIACMPFQNDRVLLLVLPFALLLLYPAFSRLEEWLRVRRVHPAAWMSLVLLLQLVFAGYALRPLMEQARVERELAIVVDRSGADHVLTHGMGAAFGNLCPDVSVTELWYGELAVLETGSLIVVKPAEMDRQWRGLPPAYNWSKACAQGMDTLAEHPAGWLVAKLH